MKSYRADPELMAWVRQTGYALVESLVEGTPRSAPILEYGHPEELYAAFADTVPLPLGPGELPTPPARLTEAVEKILRRAVHSDHPRFFNQNWAGADPVAVLGDWLTARLNTTAATYEMSALFTLMEDELLARLSVLAGFSSDEGGVHMGAGAHGLLAPGGAISNLYAVHLARSWKAPESLDSGMTEPLFAFTSDQSHYSIRKAMALTGLGRSQLIDVGVDGAGRMKPDLLLQAVTSVESQGGVPFFVNATAGTTVTGVFDVLPEIADIADEHGLWLHVDGSYGGSVLFSDRERARLDGLARARSFAMNPHKLMGITQQCAVLLVREPGLLHRAFSSGASYIFQPDKNESDLDLGDLTLQCGRRADALKLWLTWKARGEEWFGHRIDHAVDLATQLEAYLETDERFCLAHPRTFANVGFWWVPPAMRPFDGMDSLDASSKELLHCLAPQIKDRMQHEGSTMLGYQPLGDLPNFFRLLVISPDVAWADIETSLSIIDRLGLGLVERGPARAEG